MSAIQFKISHAQLPDEYLTFMLFSVPCKFRYMVSFVSLSVETITNDILSVVYHQTNETITDDKLLQYITRQMKLSLTIYFCISTSDLPICHFRIAFNPLVSSMDLSHVSLRLLPTQPTIQKKTASPTAPWNWISRSPSAAKSSFTCQHV